MVTALTFPLDLATFMDPLQIESATFFDDEPLQQTRNAAGTTLTASLGEPLWKGSIQLVQDRHAAQSAYEAKLSVLRRPGSSFFVYDIRKPYPIYDPDGSIFAASTPTILAVDADNKRMSVQGLPANYELSAGDLISFQYGTPTKYALHRIVQGETANGSGSTGLFEVTPFIRPGAATLDSVQVVKPYCKAIVLPDVSYGSGSDLFSQGGRFSFVQVAS